MIAVMKFIAQVTGLWVILWIGNQIELFCGIPIPGNVIGMLLLFLLLLCGIVKLEYLQDATDFLLKHLVFFFIPFAVGLMNWGSLFYQNGIVLAAAIIIGAIIPFATIGVLGQWLHGENEKMQHLITLFTIILTITAYLISRYLFLRYANPLLNVVFVGAGVNYWYITRL